MGKQTRTIVVVVPREKEEIKDVEVRRRRKGRPRKAPETEPTDPRKGECSGP
jgi:hypothetical protein